MERVIIGGAGRLLVALACFACALFLAALGLRLGWGIGWMAWVPAAFLLLPTLALSGRRELRRVDGSLELQDGRLFRRIYVIALAGGEIEVLPAGGAWTVVLHLGGREIALASWIRKATAERVAALFPDLPRRQPRRPDGDR